MRADPYHASFDPSANALPLEPRDWLLPFLCIAFIALATLFAGAVMSLMGDGRNDRNRALTALMQFDPSIVRALEAMPDDPRKPAQTPVRIVDGRQIYAIAPSYEVTAERDEKRQRPPAPVAIMGADGIVLWDPRSRMPGAGAPR